MTQQPFSPNTGQQAYGLYPQAPQTSPQPAPQPMPQPMPMMTPWQQVRVRSLFACVFWGVLLANAVSFGIAMLVMYAIAQNNLKGF